MNNSNAALETQSPSFTRVAAIADTHSVLTDIYRDEVNIAIWQNQLSSTLVKNVTQLMDESPNIKVVMIATPEEIAESLAEQHSSLVAQKALCQHIALLADMFCTLFEQERVGLRLNSLDRAMCPKFHVDHVPCRLVTTFSGVATQWLPHDCVDRTKLGAGSQGLADEESGLFNQLSDIQQLTSGDVALLKGSGWFNNEQGGLVHRSPAVAANEKRLLLTMDFSH